MNCATSTIRALFRHNSLWYSAFRKLFSLSNFIWLFMLLLLLFGSSLIDSRRQQIHESFNFIIFVHRLRMKPRLSIFNEFLSIWGSRAGWITWRRQINNRSSAQSKYMYYDSRKKGNKIRTILFPFGRMSNGVFVVHSYTHTHIHTNCSIFLLPISCLPTFSYALSINMVQHNRWERLKCFMICFMGSAIQNKHSHWKQ